MSITALLFFSCSQEGNEQPNYDTGDSTVAFLAHFPEASTRHLSNSEFGDLTLDYIEKNGFKFTAFQELKTNGVFELKMQEGLMATITERDGAYRNENVRWPNNIGPQ